MGCKHIPIPPHTQFTRLVTLDEAPTQPNANKEYWYNCKCECGNTVSVSQSKLRNNHTKSCGCLRKDKNIYLNHIKPMMDNNQPISKAEKAFAIKVQAELDNNWED